MRAVRTKNKKSGRCIKAALQEARMVKMNARQMRAFAARDPQGFRQYIKGARERDLMARHLLIHPEQIPKAFKAAREALADYLLNRRWRSLYNHDRRMYLLLRAGARHIEKLIKPK
jgi:hypothetical protein